MQEYSAVFFMGGAIQMGGPKTMLTDKEYRLQLDGQILVATERATTGRVYEIPRDRCVLQRKSAEEKKPEGKTK